MRFTIDEIRETVAALARQYGALRVYLFGSYARGDADADSDIDLRIDKGSIRGMQLGGLAVDLEEAFGLKVDLVSTGSLNRIFYRLLPGMRCCCMKLPDNNISISL